MLPTANVLEILAEPGHGKTSFLWGLTFMLRKLGLVWPDYLCWSPQSDTNQVIKAYHDAMNRREVPAPTLQENICRLELRLKGMERWGDRRLILEDGWDSVFPSERNANVKKREIDWGSPACWLLSLPDLEGFDAQDLDNRLDTLLRARQASARFLLARPLRLIITLTKADRMNLPRNLRQYLKLDPLAAMVTAEKELFDPELGPDSRGLAPGHPSIQFDERAVREYLGKLLQVHEEISDWLGSTLTGRLLARRAAQQHVTLRFCLVSATGADLRSDSHLQIPWSPRRVLDPFFWSLEPEML